MDMSSYVGTVHLTASGVCSTCASGKVKYVKSATEQYCGTSCHDLRTLSSESDLYYDIDDEVCYSGCDLTVTWSNSTEDYCS